jgi:F-type H+-transporting ATPase subunit gamma
VGGQVSHPLLRSGAADRRRLLLVITSNRGLCGGYNASILRTAAAYLRQHAEQDVDIEVVGKKGVGYFRFTGTPVAASFTDLGDKPAYEQVERFAEQYMQKFKDDVYAAVDVAYVSFQSVGRQSPKVLSLLPLESPAAESTDSTAAVDYEFSPGPGELLDELLPASVKARLFQCFNEAVVSEQIARMVAMKNATDAAGKMGKQLKRSYNRARQTAITTELAEIIGGAAALQ